MYSSTTIANYFISKHKYKDITAIKKLTYLSYCWYLSFEKGKRRLTQYPIKELKGSFCYLNVKQEPTSKYNMYVCINKIKQ